MLVPATAHSGTGTTQWHTDCTWYCRSCFASFRLVLQQYLERRECIFRHAGVSLVQEFRNVLKWEENSSLLLHWNAENRQIKPLKKTPSPHYFQCRTKLIILARYPYRSCVGFFEGELVFVPLFGPLGFSCGEMRTCNPECRCWGGSSSQSVALLCACFPPEHQQGGTSKEQQEHQRALPASNWICSPDTSLLTKWVRRIPLDPVRPTRQ